MTTNFEITPQERLKIYKEILERLKMEQNHYESITFYLILILCRKKLANIPNYYETDLFIKEYKKFFPEIDFDRDTSWKYIPLDGIGNSLRSRDVMNAIKEVEVIIKESQPAKKSIFAFWEKLWKLPLW